MEGADPIEAVAELVARHGAYARPVREVVAALTDRPWTLDELVPTLAVPRRTVEEVLDALGPDLAAGTARAAHPAECAGTAPAADLARGARTTPVARPGAAAGPALVIRPDRVAAYRDRFGYPQLRRTALADPLADRLAAAGDLTATLAALRAGAPRPRRRLDHVAATPQTAARRALWLTATYDLVGAHLLCVGDHDLTALAACLAEPALAATVVDVDEAVLAYVDAEARARGLHVRCLHGDLRFGLPPGAVGCADLTFTDPPYTPDGVRLFLARSAEGLADRDRGRLLLAYGFSDRAPALGWQTQQAIGALALATEAVHPHFSRYRGAQAVGGASDLYVLRPTARTWRALRTAAGSAATIYTRGAQSREGAASTMDADAAATLRAAAAGPDGLEVLAVGGSWPGPARPLGAVLIGGVPAAARAGGVALDCSADPGAWLLRVLLAVNAARVAVLVPNNHPDVADAAGQRALAGLVAAKWTLRYRRSVPDPGHAVVEAVAVDPGGLDAPGLLVRRVLDRAHGRVGRVWRDGLTAVRGVGRDEAAARVAAAAQPAAATLVETPRHRLAALLDAVAASAG